MHSGSNSNTVLAGLCRSQKGRSPADFSGPVIFKTGGKKVCFRRPSKIWKSSPFFVSVLNFGSFLKFSCHKVVRLSCFFFLFLAENLISNVPPTLSFAVHKPDWSSPLFSFVQFLSVPLVVVLLPLSFCQVQFFSSFVLTKIAVPQVRSQRSHHIIAFFWSSGKQSKTR